MNIASFVTIERLSACCWTMEQMWTVRGGRPVDGTQNDSSCIVGHQINLFIVQRIVPDPGFIHNYFPRKRHELFILFSNLSMETKHKGHTFDEVERPRADSSGKWPPDKRQSVSSTTRTWICSSCLAASRFAILSIKWQELCLTLVLFTIIVCAWPWFYSQLFPGRDMNLFLTSANLFLLFILFCRGSMNISVRLTLYSIYSLCTKAFIESS